MPEQGLPWLPGDDILTDDEVVRLIRLAVGRLGMKKVRFTGGEPLLRPGLVDIIAACAALTPRPELTLTTNALGLTKVADALRAAGLDRVNCSLDTLRADRFEKITRRRRLDAVLAGIGAARAAGLNPVKINAVLMRGINDDEAPALLAWALHHGYDMRFIEQMPLDPQHGWNRHQMMTATEILGSIQEKFRLTPVAEEERGSAPAETWLVNGGPDRVGIIGSVTRPFCGSCDRTRLTADGQIRNCLFAREESDLRTLLRSGADDDELTRCWRTATAGKLAGHGINDPGFLQPSRPMSAIGG
jgi:cyclic pyranopterin phosphate synthase